MDPTTPSLLSRLAFIIPLALLALAGAAGTLARYFTYTLVAQTRLANLASPAMATLIVNVLGSLAFGIIWALAETSNPLNPGQPDRLSPQTKLLLLTGFMGAFTTFSTFAFETGKLISDGRIALALLNLAANNVLGIGAFFVGWGLVALMYRAA